jgi:hypothetical protein
VQPLTLRLFFANEWNVQPDLPAWIVPEPGSAPLLLGAAAGLVAVAFAVRRRRRA